METESEQTMAVLVAGSTGYLGRFVVQEFKRQGHWVRALARNAERLAEPGPFMAPAVRDQIDDLFLGEVTDPETLDGLCDGIEVVFSSVGMTRQKDELSFHDVDYQGNKNILDRALEASVEKFVYVSVYNAHLMEHLAIIKAHEDFVRELQASGLPHTVIRPTGYFSDIGEYYQMAKSGRAYLFGDGEKLLNPIHGADLAWVCVDAATGSGAEVPAGGPVAYSQNEIAALAFSTLDKAPKITHIPAWMAKAGIKTMRLFDGHGADLLDFFVTAGQYENVAPQFGTHTLEDYFRALG
ncbi:MAG: NAD(P)H-binding protein [Anaerolineae bacterium]|nr:NAD(P)H-binding protein [Anaerolineae bacterium]